jgi:hypothetical protein
MDNIPLLEEVGITVERYNQVMEALATAFGRKQGVADTVEIFNAITAVAEVLPMTTRETIAITYVLFVKARKIQN